MAQIFGYFCSTDSLTPSLLAQYGEPLNRLAPMSRAAMGLGWLQEGRSLVRKHPRGRAEKVDLLSLISDVPTRGLVGHIREGHEGKAANADLQPFRFRNFVFARVGASDDLGSKGSAMRSALPDHIRRSIEGKTADEVLFHHFYAQVEPQLSRLGRQEWHRLYARTLGGLFLEGGDEAAGLLVSDRCLVATTSGVPMQYRYIEGLEEEREKPLFAGHKPGKIHHPSYRALLINAGPQINEDGWEELTAGSTLLIDQNWEPTLVSI